MLSHFPDLKSRNKYYLLQHCHYWIEHMQVFNESWLHLNLRDHLSVCPSRLMIIEQELLEAFTLDSCISNTEIFVSLLFLFCLPHGHLPEAALDPRVWPSNSQRESQVAYGHIPFSPWISSAREVDLSRDPEGNRSVDASIETTSIVVFRFPAQILAVPVFLALCS